MTQWQHTTMLNLTPLGNPPSKENPKLLEILTPADSEQTHWTTAQLSPFMRYKLTLKTGNEDQPGFELTIQGTLMPGTNLEAKILDGGLQAQTGPPPPFPRLEGP